MLGFLFLLALLAELFLLLAILADSRFLTAAELVFVREFRHGVPLVDVGVPVEEGGLRRDGEERLEGLHVVADDFMACRTVLAEPDGGNMAVFSDRIELLGRHREKAGGHIGGNEERLEAVLLCWMISRIDEERHEGIEELDEAAHGVAAEDALGGLLLGRIVLHVGDEEPVCDICRLAGGTELLEELHDLRERDALGDKDVIGDGVEVVEHPDEVVRPAVLEGLEVGDELGHLGGGRIGEFANHDEPAKGGFGFSISGARKSRFPLMRRGTTGQRQGKSRRLPTGTMRVRLLLGIF